MREGQAVRNLFSTKSSDGYAGPVRGSYVARHWRGDLSLARSYWVNGLLLSFIAAFPAAILWWTFFGPLSVWTDPLKAAIGLAAAWGITVVVAVWQLIGTWRSATRHRSRGGWAVWAWVAGICVIVGLLGVAQISVRNGWQFARLVQTAVADPREGPVGVWVLSNGDIEFNDMFGPPIFSHAYLVYDLLAANPQASMIHLNSPGGSVNEARAVQRAIAERGLSTYVSSVCASACTIAFMGGRQRYLAPGARLGFHGVSGDDAEEWNEGLRRGLIARGVEPWFADKTTSDTMWWPSTQELLDANVITGVCKRRLEMTGPDCP